MSVATSKAARFSGRLLPYACGAALVVAFKPLKAELARSVGSADSAGWLIVAGVLACAAVTMRDSLAPLLTFAYACFLQPLGKAANQKARLDKFYQGQADVYDSTRTGLLRGRKTMLKLSAAALKEQRRKQPSKRLVWLDIGGGTGWNIEEMDKYFSIKDFDAVYLLDLCEPLLEVARKRFERRGWTNVHVICQDATAFTLPQWSESGIDPEGALDFVTMSYALSMIPNFYALIDRIDRFLHPMGLVSVCDFYVSGRESPSFLPEIGDVRRQCSWLNRLFWLHWFELDHVDLHPSRRQYLEFKFGTVLSYNGRNKFVLPWIVRIPYYINICCKATRDTSSAVKAFEVESGNTIGSATNSPVLVPIKNINAIDEFSIGQPMLRRSNSTKSESVRINVGPSAPLSSFHYQLHRTWRLPYMDVPLHKEFRTWIYGFTWEDPRVDIEHLKLTKDDSVMVITSAGDNALHYAIAGRPRRLHCVDMNPCQGHLLELKLAAISSLEYDDFWLLFGEGRHPRFRELLDNKISPFLSSHAYQFWRANDSTFDSSFYLRGYSGWALRLVKWAAKVAGIEKDVKALCEAKTIEEQKKIWHDRIRGVILNKTLVKVFFSNPVFLWNALGVPMNQANCFLAETTTEQYAIDTLEPVVYSTLVRSQNYHYQVCLQHKYTRGSCPLYLTREGFAKLKANNGRGLDSFRLHTDSIINVLKQLEPGSLTVWVGMDHMDWFTPSNAAAPPTEVTKGHTISAEANKPCELTLAIQALRQSLAVGGRAFWRSAAMNPWYARIFAENGFKVERVSVREVGSKQAIDTVNMYASLWKATRVN